MAALLGGHVRVGLEDSLYLERGKLATSNAEQVATVRDVLERLGLEIATPDEARRLLGLKGRSDPALARENQPALGGSA
ncbi:3-keto-5-aminohexanoate cleavage enzyme [compost metagenome]